MKRIKIRRISKEDKEKLFKKGHITNGLRPVKYKYLEKKMSGKRIKKRID